MKGIVAGGSQQTVAAGAEMLRQGGNAVDAAVAAICAGFVAEAAISSPGGGGFGLVSGPDREPVLYDFFGTAPGLGARDPHPAAMDFTRVSVTFEDAYQYFHVGRASSAVPGNIAGLAQMLAEAGTLPWGTVLEPAIRLARDGFALSAGQAYLIKLVGRAILCYTPESAAIFAPAGHLLREGEHFANPTLARTLERLAADGPGVLYTGWLADALLAEHRAHDGLITAEDLAAYHVIRRQPLQFTYRDAAISTNPPPSVGGILIAHMLRLLEQADLSGLDHSDAYHTALLAEIVRHNSLLRERDRPDQLPDAAAWTRWLGADAIAAEWAQVAAAVADGPGEYPANAPRDPGNTTHVSAIDETGLAVGITTTPGETGGYVLGDTGFLMNNLLGEDDVNPDGFHVWEPGTRLGSMMAPTLVGAPTGVGIPTGVGAWENEGKTSFSRRDTASGRAAGTGDRFAPWLVAGSGGSNRLRTAIAQFLSNVLDWRLPVREAVERPRLHFENDAVQLEGGYDPACADLLRARGYDVNLWSERSLYFGGTHVVMRTPDGLRGAGDPRRGGAVALVE